MAGGNWARCSRAVKQPPKFELLSMLAHCEATREMPNPRIHGRR